ncbi:hypothetical protein BDA99DRAFT_593298 [Phascolomyces articulosus]|uniref:Heterokaryon incompatibility domain-containing protein n=1 Tax=Phascolomyces articulosus TaxID=60185 RepID=A0AAD5K7J1_9FUNG|nr:hypothetical protein BDA99DRAFT_593298 [Phascolomyces articulosus]
MRHSIGIIVPVPPVKNDQHPLSKATLFYKHFFFWESSKMYITYCRNQISMNPVVEDTTSYRLNATAGSFRPTYLVRVSDWKKVPGHEAKNGYCALSYVWKQSVEIVPKNEHGDYDCIDNAKHCIVEGNNNAKSDNNISTKTKHFFMRTKKDRIAMVPAKEGEPNEYIPQFLPSKKSKATVKHVTYSQLLQHICQDFQIEYLWYDKLCIDSSNKETKLQEIKRMHCIYLNARYTVAIVPELHVHDPKDFNTQLRSSSDTYANAKAWEDIERSLWWKRSWTLQETLMSRNILIVGADTHKWQHSFHTNNIPTTYDEFSVWMLDFINQSQDGRGGSINQALSQAHFRASSKEHDRIFSLINIFPGMFKNMEISYERDIKSTFNYCYRTMVINDMSILCFGSNLYIDGKETQTNTMTSHHLPSWTGVSGLHLTDRITTTSTNWLLPSSPSVDDDMFLHISTKYYKTLSVSPYSHGCYSTLAHRENKKPWYNQMAMYLDRRGATDLFTTGDNDMILIDWAVTMDTGALCFATHYSQLQPPSQHIVTTTTIQGPRPLSLTEDCQECILLPILLKSHKMYTYLVKGSEPLQLRNEYDVYYYFLPVFKKCGNTNGSEEERFKAIGIYLLGGPDDETHLRQYSEDEILKMVFSDDATHDQVKEFVIQ